MPSTITEPVTVRIRGNALKAVEAQAASEGITRSRFVALAVYRELQRKNNEALTELGSGQNA
jgi:hypothetical protein